MKTEYNPQLDEIIWEERLDITDPFSRSPYKQMFLVRVVRYNNGKPKLEIKRLSYGRGNKGTFLKTGRFTKAELADLMPMMQKAIDEAM